METFGQPLWFGKYRLTSRLATGGMAEVYVGRQVSSEGQFGPMVAVKRLQPHLVKDSAMVRMFLNEAKITSQIHHPNVVTVFELGQVDGEPFIAMELLEGRTWAELRLRAAESGKRMPAGVALRILTEACRGLDAAHRALDQDGKPLALVHRDFTPDNIHVGVKGDVKVIDFGIARTSSWGSGTEPGTLKGKFFYMSPEMIAAKPVDHRADIFAAGVMLYEQLCGRRPFTGSSIDEVVFRIAREEPAPPSAHNPSVPKPLQAICLKAIAKEPAERFQTLGEFVEAMEHAEVQSPLAEPQEVAAYVTSLFPENSAERRTLRQAREADPSLPGHTPLRPSIADESLEATLPAPIRAHQPLAERTEAVPAHSPLTERTEAVTAHPPLAERTEAAPAHLQRRRFSLPAVLGVLGLLAVSGGAWWALRTAPLSASEQLAKAEQSPGKEQINALLRLGSLPDATDSQLARAGALLTEAKEWDAALTLIDSWLLKHPKSLAARLLEARAAVQTRKGKRAELAVHEAAILAPSDARPDALLAELRELQADSAAALDAWTKAVSKAPGDAYYLARQGYWLSQSGRLDEAETALTKAGKKRPDAATMAELGFVKFRKEQPGEALRILRAVVKEKPELLEGHYYLAAVHFQRNELAAARAEYLAADALAGSDSRPLMALCQMEQMQQTSGLEAARKKIRERFPTEADALLSKCAAAAPNP